MAAAVLWCGPSFAAGTPGVVAKVNGVAITEGDLEKAIDAYIPPGAFHGSVGGKKRDEYRKPALDLLIERELFYQEAKARGMRVDDKEVDKALDDIKKQFGDKKAFDSALKGAGLTLKEYRSIVRRNVLIDKLLKMEVDDKAKYADKELREYYNSNKRKFMRPEVMRIRHILLKAPPTATEEEKKAIRDKAEEIFNKTKAGEDFAELASKYSEDDYRIKGGDLGFVHKGRLEPEVEAAAEKVVIGEPVITETLSGFHIFRVEEKKPPQQLEFTEVKDSLKRDLETKRSLDLKTAFLESLKKKAKIEIY